MHSLFFELTAVIVCSALAGALMQALRLPTILGYIFVGAIAAPLGFLSLQSVPMLDSLAEIGIASLLFLVGMEMRLDQMRSYGKVALFTGLGQIAVTSVVGYGLVRLLGFAPLPAAYIAVALTFSSTIIVIKLLSEKSALDTRYGRLVVGFLLVQDFIALGCLIVLSGITPGERSLAALPYDAIGMAFVKGSLLLAGTMAIGRFVLPRVMRWAAHSPEVVFLLSLAWGMGMAAFAASPAMGLTIEIGAFMAGLAMSGTVERHHVISRVKPLRDFFIVLFFVTLGSRIAIGNLGAVALPAAVLSAFVLIGNPLLMLCIMGAMGFRSRVSWLASVCVAQISEFSLIMMALGAKLGHVDQGDVTLVTLVGIVTIALSSFLITNAERIYPHLRPFLILFEKRSAHDEAADAKRRKGHVILIGCHRIGHNVLRSLEKAHRDLTVIDLDPEVVQTLIDRGIDAVYGDIADPEIRETAGFESARLIISTIPDVHAATHALRSAKKLNPRAKVVLTAQSEHDAEFFYREGADYVILPHFMSGMQMAHVIKTDKTLRSLARMKKHDLALIDGSF
ncbi:MAG: hypothetical protein RLZZ324_449 [Candidatus Parcubacteria bacterium]|jgi:Kef-type K+ transport system membrane component KefB/voltage-gated potassium channel Kch